MLLVESWLRSFVNPPLNTADLAHALTMSGAEVESIRPVAPAFSGIVVGHIIAAEKHPDADKLKVCKVDIGAGEPLQIVCGAPNAAVGMKAPLATVGAVLPDGTVIGKGKLRGIESFGMLCSQRELGLSTEHAGLWALPESAVTGQDIRVAMDLDDTVLEIKLTPNKTDCLSVWGMARETAAITGAALSAKTWPTVTPTISDTLPVTIEAADLCGQFTGRVIKGVNAKAQAPAWMVSRLERAGQRSISALVDISNYVMLELGRPTHVFDLAKIHGNLTVRWAKAGETLKLLNGTTITLDPSVGVIADDSQVESLAGIMGGDSTAVSDDTSDIYLEAAFWHPLAIQGRARKYNFSTDAAHRFERGVDPATTRLHLDYITDLILTICGGACGPVTDIVTGLPERKPVALRVARCNKVLGITLTESQMADTFKRLGFEHSVGTGEQSGVITVTPASWRFDIEIEEDLIEEVARLFGFDNIPTNAPVAPQYMQAQPEGTASLHSLRLAMAGRDYMEAINYSFVDASWETDFAANANPITLLNPIASNMSVMRSTLIGGLVANVKHHLSHRMNRVRMFELGKVFLRDDSVLAGDVTIAGYDQPQRLCGIAYGSVAPAQWGIAARAVDFYDLKADLEALCPGLSYEKAEHVALHPGRSARVSRDGVVIGWIGELHPKLCQAYDLPNAPVVFEVDAQPLCQRGVPLHADIAKTPVLERDLAVVVDAALPAQTLVNAIRASADAALKALSHVAVFDQFKGGNLPADKKSIALRLQFQDASATMTDSQADAALAAALQTLQTACNATLR
jgi:phenylalanyl-tRNA synthetase beta chain